MHFTYQKAILGMKWSFLNIWCNPSFNIYNSLFQSHISYCTPCWGFGNLTRLEKLQKKSIRIITKSKYNSHTTKLFSRTKILKIEDLFKLNCLKIYYKFCHDTLPAYFATLPFNKINNTPGVRPRRQIMYTPRYTNSQELLPILSPSVPIEQTERVYSRKCVRYFIPLLLNSKYLPDSVDQKMIHTLWMVSPVILNLLSLKVMTYPGKL